MARELTPGMQGAKARWSSYLGIWNGCEHQDPAWESGIPETTKEPAMQKTLSAEHHLFVVTSQLLGKRI